jgi:regulatory protein
MPDSESQLFNHDAVDTSAQVINPADIRIAAMNLLARREHSRRELKQKLRRRFDDEALVDAELQRLAEKNLQSDERFAESFVRQRAGRGYGLLRVRQGMREKGLGDSEISLAIDAADIDWRTLAAEVYRKKYGDLPAADLKEKARRARFMQYRGFSPELS